MQDSRITVRMILGAVSISIGTVERVLTEDLNLNKVCQVHAKYPLQRPKAVSH